MLSGAATPDQLLDNLAGIDIAWSADFDERIDAFAEEPAAYWERRSRLPWG